MSSRKSDNLPDSPNGADGPEDTPARSPAATPAATPAAVDLRLTSPAPGGPGAPGGPIEPTAGARASRASRSGWRDALASNGGVLAALAAIVGVGVGVEAQPALALWVLLLLIFAAVNVPLFSSLPRVSRRVLPRFGGVARVAIVIGVMLALNAAVAALLPWLGLADFSPEAGYYYGRILTLIGISVILSVSLQLINGFSGQFSLGHAGFMAVGAYLAAYPAKLYSHRLQDPAAVLAYYVALAIVLAVAAGTLGLLFAGLRASRRVWSHLPAVLMLLVVGWAVWDVARAARYVTPPPYLVWSNAAALLTRSFEMMTTHWVPAASRLSAWLPAAAREPVCFLVLLGGGGLCAAAAGLLVGLPTLRLRGDYLAIATLGMAEIIRILITNSQPLGGALGLTGIPKYTNFAWLFGAALVTIVVVWRVAYSARGRAIQAVREDEIAAAAVGINPTRQKVLAFVLGAFFGGVAGGLFAFNERSITPGYFGLQKSIEIVVIVTLGGLGSISGAILAAVVLTLLPEVLRPIAEFRMIIYSLLLVGMMLTRPQGLLGGRELWPRRWRKQRAKGAGVGAAAAGAPSAAPSRPTAAADRSLEARHASRRFGGLAALTDFCICVGPTELVGLIGPNGAGKTTAFNLITGVYVPSAGEVRLAGRRIDRLTPVAINHAGIARTFQNIRLFKSLTALDNVAAAFSRSKEHGLLRTVLRTPRFFRERYRSEADATDLLTTLGLAEDADLPAGSLPYGDQRRLEIARALATRPTILLLDEPAAGMNPQEKVELMALIRFIRDRFAVGILLIEHDMKLVMSICERITVLDHGETIAVGTPTEVRRNPEVIEAYLGETTA
jgi:branched-chain amino acid transport system permease protein